MVSLQKAELDHCLLQGLFRAILFTARAGTKLPPPLQKVVLIGMLDTHACARTHTCTHMYTNMHVMHAQPSYCQPSLGNWSHSSDFCSLCWVLSHPGLWGPGLGRAFSRSFLPFLDLQYSVSTLLLTALTAQLPPRQQAHGEHE